MIDNDLLQTLPPGTWSEECDEPFEECEHWAHQYEDGVVLSGVLRSFLKSQCE